MAETLFEAPLTLFGLPLSQSFSEARVAVLGIPFDCGIDPTRFGPRLGPNAIRQASVLTATLLQDADVSPLDGVIDAGNVRLALDDIQSAFDSIERAMREVLRQDCVPLTLGGDGAVSLPQMRAIREFHDKVAVLHFDAHTDAWKLDSNDHFDNTTQFTHAVNEDLIDVPNTLHVGTRGPVNAQRAIDYARGLGYEVIPYTTVRNWGEERLLAHLHERLAGRKVYLCFDMDFFDPSIAPGVATPTPGGAGAAEGLAFVRGLRGLDIIAADINTVTPVHDPAGVTASLAASVAAECLALVNS
jgi:agmatinase